jgi:hypothetical protein
MVSPFQQSEMRADISGPCSEARQLVLDKQFESQFDVPGVLLDFPFAFKPRVADLEFNAANHAQ